MGRVTMVAAALAAWGAGFGTAHAEVPAGTRYDDGFVRFAAVNHPSEEKWHLESSVRLIGTGVARGSAFKFVLKQGRRVLSTTVCEGELQWRGEAQGPPDSFHAAGCIDRQQAITVAGAMTVNVIFIDDDSGEETLVRTHPLDVRSVRRERLAGNNGPSHFFVNLHGEAPVILIEQVEMGQRRARADLGGGGSAARRNNVYVNWIRSPEGNLRDMTLRCRVDGNRIDLGDDDIARPVSGSGYHRQAVNQVLRVPGQVNTEQDDIAWVWDVVQLPLTFGSGDGAEWTRYVNMGAHPGRWECLLRRQDRRVIRTFAFTVGADRLIQPHPEEGAGLVLAPFAHLADGSIPEDSPVDERTDPAAARAGAFFGRAWATPEGRALGAGVPAIGEAYPSTARARRGRGRGRRR